MPHQAYSVVGYIRVSTAEQADSGAGLEAQRAAIQAEALRRGWTLLRTFEDAGASGKSMTGRPGLQEALQAVEHGEAASACRREARPSLAVAARLRVADGAGTQARLELSSPSTSALIPPHRPAR